MIIYIQKNLKVIQVIMEEITHMVEILVMVVEISEEGIVVEIMEEKVVMVEQLEIGKKKEIN